MKTIFFLAPLFFAFQVNATSLGISGLYVKTFGDKANQALIFVHGGPGFNSHDFEVTTAKKLSSEGFFVVVYDQRGQGRSDEAPESDFNYKTYSDDIKKIIDDLEITSPILLGHSHGGPISINFDQDYPGIAKSIILVSAPINFLGSMKSLFENCSRKYLESENSKGLEQLSYLYYELFVNEATSFELNFLVGSSFLHGMQCGLYKTKKPTEEAIALNTLLNQNAITEKMSGATTAMHGFLKNENYIKGNYVSYVFTQKGRYFGIYGDEDGLFTPLELALVKSVVSNGDEAKSFKLVKGSSHSIFIDQQTEFIRVVKEFSK